MNEVAARLLDQIAERTMGSGQAGIDQEIGLGRNVWQWQQGVALYGLTQAFEATENRRFMDYMKAWVDHRLSPRSFGRSINTTAPMLAVLQLWERTGERRYYDLCAEFADWCLAEAPRASRGALEHSCTMNTYPNQIWADTLFMSCIFLARWSKLTGHPVYAKEAARQFILHYQYLHDPQTGLIYHGYYGNERKQMGVLWGRGNGWFAAASVDVLEMLGDEIPEKSQISSQLLRFMKGAAEVQHESGAWHTVMNHSETYLEMSVTAAFAYALAKGVRLKYLDPSYREPGQSAIRALFAHIDGNGVLTHASGGTSVMPGVSDYQSVAFAPTYFSQGLAMMAISEALRTQKSA